VLRNYGGIREHRHFVMVLLDTSIDYTHITTLYLPPTLGLWLFKPPLMYRSTYS
jgi:hypothetical protein